MDLINFSSTGTEAGYSKAKKWLGCTARAAADERSTDTRSIYPEEGKPEARTVGSIYGELVQRWYRGEPVRDSAQFAWDGVPIGASHPLTCAEAKRLYNEYTKKYDPDRWGEVLECEVQVEIPESLFGMRMTGAIDMVTRYRGGIWIIDFKTEGKNDKNMREKYSLVHQNWELALAYELKTGVKPDGVAYDVIVKNKTPDFHPLEYEGLTEQRLRWLKLMFEDVKAARAAQPRPKPCEDNCLAYYRACPYLVNGVCSFI